jgi:hypothetical protein
LVRFEDHAHAWPMNSVSSCSAAATVATLAGALDSGFDLPGRDGLRREALGQTLRGLP